MVFVSLFVGGEMVMKKVRLSQLNRSQMITLLFIGVLSAGFNFGMQQGYVTAPNIGYINAMNASSIGLVVIGSAIFFKDELTLRKFIGVIGVIAGLVLIVI